MKTNIFVFRRILFIILLMTISMLKSIAQSPPATFSHSMTYNGVTIMANFEQFSTRGPAFQVLEQVGGGSLNDVTSTFTDIRTYIGSIVGYPGAIACAVYRDGGRPIEANVIFESGYQWFDQAGTVTDYSPVDTLVIPNFPTFQLRIGGSGTILYSADIGIDVANNIVVESGGSLASAVEMAEYSLMVNNLPFIRDISVINRLKTLVIRVDQASDPYTGGGTDVFGSAPWSSGYTEDLLVLVSQDIGTPTAFGILADMALSLGPAELGGEFGGTMRHEVGHNWGMGHQDGGQPEGKTISSGNELAKFSGPAIENICKVRDDKLANLDNLGTLTSPNFPPRAADDIFIFEPSLASDLVINVLDNDRDVNGSPISILSFDSLTQNGILITQVGNTLTIPNPSIYSSNPDRFKYRIQDSTGKTSTAFVNIKSEIPSENVGFWTFDNTKNRALDSGTKANTGRIYGNAHINSANELVLDGHTDFVKSPPLGITTNEITFSAFVYSNSTQSDDAGIIMGSDQYGIKIAQANELYYLWNSFEFFTTLSLPNNTWTFVSLVISPNSATLYMNAQGGTLESEVTNMTLPIMELKDDIMIGDGYGADLDIDPPFLPYFNGRMDDVRIINRALTQAEIMLLSDKKMGARDPIPFHTESVLPENVTVKWSPSPNAMGQKLFVSSNYSDVKSGNISSQISGINATSNMHTLPNASGNYYWRVETIESDLSINNGSIWSFYVGNSNHTGSCSGLVKPSFAVESPTGLTTDGINIYTTGTTGALESNWVFQQKNIGTSGFPLQCYNQNSYAGNNSAYSINFILGMTVIATSGGIVAYNHSGTTPCAEVWSIGFEGTGIGRVGNRLFISELDEIHELNPNTGAIISSQIIDGVSSISRFSTSTSDSLYFTYYLNGTQGGVGLYNINTQANNLLPGVAGSGLLNPKGITVNSNGSLLVAETDKRRIISIDPSSGVVSTFVNGFIAPSDVIILNDTLYIADEGAHEVRKIKCGPILYNYKIGITQFLTLGEAISVAIPNDVIEVIRNVTETMNATILSNITLQVNNLNILTMQGATLTIEGNLILSAPSSLRIIN